jgi:hypothetical protein
VTGGVALRHARLVFSFVRENDGLVATGTYAPLIVSNQVQEATLKYRYFWAPGIDSFATDDRPEAKKPRYSSGCSEVFIFQGRPSMFEKTRR